MKLSGWILRISLIAMVTLSLVFSFLIWQNPSRLGRQETNVTVKTTKDPNVAQQASHVFSPTTAYYQQDDRKTMLFTADGAITDKLRTAMTDWQLTKMGPAKKLSASDYTTLLATHESLQLLYAGPVAFDRFNRTFFAQRLTTGDLDFQFTRILVDLTGAGEQLQFINDRTRTVHTAPVTGAKVAPVRDLVRRAATTGFDITEMRLSGREVATFNTAIKVTPYTFLLDQQSANHFVSLLMPSNSASAVDTREIGAETVYTRGASQRLTLDTDTGGIQFEDATVTTRDQTLATALRQGYTSLGKLGLQGLNTMRYFGYDTATRTVTFRACALGLPIFNANDNGVVTTANTQSGRQLNFSMYNLTVAIPTTQAAVSLPSTATVFAQLQGAGYDVSALQDMVLGYYWKADSESSQVVSLTPTYFVKINGLYKRYTQWVDPTDEAATASEVKGASTGQALQ
ncbi:YycH family regulatory protein [Lacticaseibacillus absianus]|uniref:YycH family regulatory protein n=1 Tax=Lacticaseibacillus absianus TaxID=2729623 RepID=UPI0015C8BBC6|nr:two-component system activity regulator YycH [Lacticaseibacillus absianus]